MNNQRISFIINFIISIVFIFLSLFWFFGTVFALGMLVEVNEINWDTITVSFTLLYWPIVLISQIKVWRNYANRNYITSYKWFIPPFIYLLIVFIIFQIQ